jgi:2-amino-4-hydroxy-6-hydroxymethyldihydropteridine diphosphokinase
MIYLSLGSNLGDKEGNILRAYTLIEQRIGHIARKSSLHRTAPWGFESSNDFLNSVIAIETSLTPRELLTETQRIEKEIGRTAKTSADGTYQDRLIDIDILIYNDLIIDEPDLQIPHPLMNQRDFVLNPLKEVYD